jgi:hypothetical protein
MPKDAREVAARHAKPSGTLLPLLGDPPLPEKEGNVLRAIRADFVKFGYTPQDADDIIVTLGSVLCRRNWLIRRHVVYCSNCRAEVEVACGVVKERLETEVKERARQAIEAAQAEKRQRDAEANTDPLTAE